MSYLLFMDESGHDHKTMPYEVRGGIALHARELWPFIQAMRHEEKAAFGTALSRYGGEVKGRRLLDADRFRWAAQGGRIADALRRRHARAFLSKGLEGRTPTRAEFTAYGQACLAMARGVLRLLHRHAAVLFASAIPAQVRRPAAPQAHGFLRKDHVFLLERFFYFLEDREEHGLLVMDETEKELDRQFVRRLQAYFTRTATGRLRTGWIVPAPLFVASDMNYPVQAADVCIYCLNWGFRLPARGMNAPVREEISAEFAQHVARLQYRGSPRGEEPAYRPYGIVFVPDPYTGRRQA